MKRKLNNDEPGVGAPRRTGISLAEILNPVSRDRGERSRTLDRAQNTAPQDHAAMALNRLSVLDALAARPDGLHWAAGNGLANVVDCQLKSGANPNCTDQHGNTPLHWAAGMGYLKVVDVLLVAGADPRAANLKGATALVLATERGHKEVVDRLSGAVRSAQAPRVARLSVFGHGRSRN